MASAVRLDWETAFAEYYRLEARADPTSSSSKSKAPSEQEEVGLWTVLFDGSKGELGPDHRLITPGRSTVTSGQSPGVKQKIPLHVIHTIILDAEARKMKFRYLRLYILKPASNWGVSVWQFDVYGEELGIPRAFNAS